MQTGPFSLYENEDQKPPKRSTVLSYLLIVIMSGLLLSSDISEKLNYDDGLSMTYYEFAIIVVFLQALIGAVRFSKCKLPSYRLIDYLGRAPFVDPLDPYLIRKRSM